MNISREYSRCEESLDRLTKEKKHVEYKISDDTQSFKNRAIMSGISTILVLASIIASIVLTPLFLAVTFLTGYVAFKEISDAVFYRNEIKEFKDKLGFVNMDIENTEKYRDKLVSEVNEKYNRKVEQSTKETTISVSNKQHAEEIEPEL